MNTYDCVNFIAFCEKRTCDEKELILMKRLVVLILVAYSLLYLGIPFADQVALGNSRFEQEKLTVHDEIIEPQYVY